MTVVGEIGLMWQGIKSDVGDFVRVFRNGLNRKTNLRILVNYASQI